jgi:hypothetical protein
MPLYGGCESSGAGWACRRLRNPVLSGEREGRLGVFDARRVSPFPLELPLVFSLLYGSGGVLLAHESQEIDKNEEISRGT